jgi:hypothetical protein
VLQVLKVLLVKQALKVQLVHKALRDLLAEAFHMPKYSK